MPWKIYDPANPNENVFFGGSDVASQRYILTLNGVNSYIDTGGYTYSGDFWIEVKVQLPTQLPASSQAFFGGSGGGSPNQGSFATYLNTSSQGLISAQIPTTSGMRYDLSAPVAAYLGSTIKLRLERTSGIWLMLINDSAADTFNSNSFGVVDVEVSSIARWATALYYAGAIYDYKDSFGNNLPINDRTFGVGAVIKNTGTGSDAVGVNLLESGWTEIPL